MTPFQSRHTRDSCTRLGKSGVMKEKIKISNSASSELIQNVSAPSSSLLSTRCLLRCLSSIPCSFAACCQERKMQKNQIEFGEELPVRSFCECVLRRSQGSDGNAWYDWIIFYFILFSVKIVLLWWVGASWPRVSWQLSVPLSSHQRPLGNLHPTKQRFLV